MNVQKVSFYKSIKDVSPFYQKDVVYFLDRIKNGKSKKLVFDLRIEADVEKKVKLKQLLPVVTFGGEFTRRGNDYLKKSSGLMILDFDKLDDVLAKKELIIKSVNVFACWISPSGNGLKALIRIPGVKDDREYKQFFKQINNKFKDVDPSGKDIARACFESFDEDLYINLNAEEFPINYDDINLDPVNIGTVTNVPITDQDEIANRLMVWFKKVYDENCRNNSLYKLASAFNDFGIIKQTCESYLFTFEQQDFSRDEITQLIGSAYKKQGNFGTKSFEDKEKKDKISNLVLSGRPESEIKEQFPELDKKKLTSELAILKANIDVNKFWEYNHRNEIEILPYRLKMYLESLHYYKYYPIDNSRTFVFITKTKNFINSVSEYQVKDQVMVDLVKRNEIEVFNVVAERTKVFTPQYLSILDTAKVTIERDGPDYSMIYYQNKAVKVFFDRYEIFDYDELKGYVWENQIIKREFIKADHHDSMFRSFVWFISGQDVDRYNTMKSIIGYMLHSYKTSADNKAIILNDETISDTPNGGSGKGIVINAIGHMKRLSTIDGKTFDFNKSFPYQTVSSDCQVLAFDDVKRNFDFERLFSLITEGITIEYKGKDAIKLPVKESPKICITTNYTIRASGGSFERRMFEVELSSYFSVNHTPLDEFGKMLFEDWDDEEWARFDHYMINCLQYYLENGLVKSEPKNLKLRKFINNTSQEFYDFIEDGNIKLNERIIKAEIYELFKTENPELKWLNKRLFAKWLKDYALFKDYEYESGNTNGQRWVVIKSDEDAEINTNITPF